LQCCAIIPCSSSIYEEESGSVVNDEINTGDDDGWDSVVDRVLSKTCGNGK
jgi:hypothetical protein